MRILDRMLLSIFFPVMAGSLLFGMLMLGLVDLFQYLNRFTSAGVGWVQILMVQWYHLPKTLGWSLPIALLFATSYSMGSLYARNELVAVFSTGVSIRRFTLPLLVLGAFFCLAYLVFEDRVIIPSSKAKRLLSNELLNQYESFSQSNVSFISARGRIVYNVVFFNFETKVLHQVTVLFRDETGAVEKRVDAESGDWTEGRLVLRKVRIFAWDGEEEKLTETWSENYTHADFSDGPEIFEQRMTRLEDLSIPEAIPFLQSLEASGLPSFKDAQTNFFQRIAFAFTPLIVVLISSAIGGRLKKNILLMSLLTSLGISVAYYVLQMITGLLSRFGYVPPLLGSMIGVVAAGAVGFQLYRRART